MLEYEDVTQLFILADFGDFFAIVSNFNQTCVTFFAHGEKCAGTRIFGLAYQALRGCKDLKGCI